MPAALLPLLAVVAGVVSVTSPCALPLLPGYLSYVSALPVADLDQRGRKRLLLTSSSLFVAGFTLVFTVLGAAAALGGSLFLQAVPVAVRVAGVGIIALGLVMAGFLRIPFLQRERRMDLGRLPKGPGAAFPLGMAFAAGWTPCAGPVLAVIITAAAATQTVVWGAALLALYSLGLGLPFIALALGFGRLRASLRWLQRHGRQVELAGGLLLVAVGVAFVSGQWAALFRPLQRSFAQLGWPPI
ncbi:MAG: cytochrome c biogenesis CcdA family protein [Acidimicrobiales bacterium]